MTPAETEVLLAAVAVPLQRYSEQWHRLDLPAPAPVKNETVNTLERRGLLTLVELPLVEAYPTADGLTEARRIRRQLPGIGVLRALGEADELVRWERRTTQAEAAAILMAAGLPADRVVEWVRPTRGRADEGRCVCSGVELETLRQLGLVVLLAGDTRAQLTGAGRWCADIGPESDSNGSGPGEATGGAQGAETAPEGRQRPSKEVLR